MSLPLKRTSRPNFAAPRPLVSLGPPPPKTPREAWRWGRPGSGAGAGPQRRKLSSCARLLAVRGQQKSGGRGQKRCGQKPGGQKPGCQQHQGGRNQGGSSNIVFLVDSAFEPRVALRDCFKKPDGHEFFVFMRQNLEEDMSGSHVACIKAKKNATPTVSRRTSALRIGDASCVAVDLLGLLKGSHSFGPHVLASSFRQTQMSCAWGENPKSIERDVFG